jgi:L-asparaginase
MSKVHILATGGVIPEVAEVEIDQDFRFRTASVDVGFEQLVMCSPAADSLADIEVENFARLAGDEANQFVWTRLAARINGLFATGAADGVVVTHCADTIEETAYYLHLVVKNRRPVVVTCVTRAVDVLDRDCLSNLYNAVAVAADGRAFGRGVILLMDDSLHSARDVTRVNSMDARAFVSPGRGLLGIVSAGSIRYFRRPIRRHTSESQFAADLSVRLPRVDILYSHVDMSPDLVGACVALGASGLVIAGTGRGNVPKNVARELAEVAEHGVVVVRSSRVENADSLREMDLLGDMNLITVDQLNPQKSRILLQLCLARGMGRDAIQQAFNRY